MPNQSSSVHVAISLEGGIFIFLLIGLGTAAFLFGHGGLMLLFCILLVATIIMAGMAHRNLANIQIERRFVEEIFAGRDTRIDLIIHNNGNHALSGLHIYDTFEGKTCIGPIFVPKLPPQSTSTARYMCQFPQRGKAHFCGFQVRSRFPLPFFEFRADLPNDESAMVYPKLEKGINLIHFKVISTDPSRRVRKPDTVIREVTNGRRTGKILWKLSARRQKLMEATPVKTRSAEPIPVIDILPKQAIGSELFEKQISQITHFILERIQNAQPGKIIIDNITYSYGYSHPQRQALLDALSLI